MSGASRPRVVYHDGAYVAESAAVVPVASQAMRYALSVFEGVRMYTRSAQERPRAFRLEDHLRRLRQSLRVMQMPCDDLDTLPAIIERLVDDNAIDHDCYVRIAVSVVSPGTMRELAIRTATTVSVTSMGRKSWLAEGRAMRVCIGPWQQPAALAFPPEVKCIARYAGARMASLQARRSGYDEIILLGANGHLTEAPTANLFLVRDGIVWTPPVRDGALPGITRATLLELAASRGLTARIESLSRDDAYGADEAFVCGTGLELAPIESFDGLPVSCQGLGPITKSLIGAYFETVRSSTDGRAALGAL